MSIPTPGAKNLIISGVKAGIKVRCNPRTKPLYDKLVSFSLLGFPKIALDILNVEEI
ncbi:MAG: hypothetical protein OEZ39_14760 [Gammaproteobacteria bacterium]|nr:hypothetical protein [Gammaproteobacteria bacterium]MDH5653115.1 hypothetical protein [Gammaproteobacteria bacterium]